jgi:lipoate-protein ligase A
MYGLISHSTDPFINLATEEYLLKKGTEEYFMLWQNEPSIIVGKHQNTLAEINMNFVKQNHLKIARRLTGGGTVYHDLGNLNFTFIMNGEEDDLVNFRRYTKPIVTALQSFSLEIEYGQRNDLLLEGLKISGNAEHVFGKRVIHHGTLLFSSDLNRLQEALRVNPLKYTDKAVKSFRSRITNIRDHLPQPISMETFRDQLFRSIVTNSPDNSFYELTENDQAAIKKLALEKYSTWEWIYGYSPDYCLKKECMIEGKKVLVELVVRNGLVEDINFSRHDLPWLEHLRKHLAGKPHNIDFFIDLASVLGKKLSAAEDMNDLLMSFF